MTLAHDPRISSDTRRLKARGSRGPSPTLEAYGEHGNMIQSDPPEHDKHAPPGDAALRPPHSPDLIPHGGGYPEAMRRVARQGQGSGKTRFDVVDEYAYPVPVAVICKILGMPLKDEAQFHVWIHDIMAGMMDIGPEAATEEGKIRAEKGKRAGRTSRSTWQD